jgi:hypothetical protein
MSSRSCRRRLIRRLTKLLVEMRKVRMESLRRVLLRVEHLRPQLQESN